MNYFIRFILAMLFFMTSMDAHALNDPDPSFEEINLAINLYQEDWKIAEIGERTYFNPSAIVLQENQITLIVGPFQVQIPNLYQDSYGIYIFTEMCAEYWLSWQCCRCTFYNSKSWNTCQNCHKPRC